MKYETRTFWMLAISTVLVFAFQNCGSASYSSDSLIYQTPLNSLDDEANYTKFEGGQAFDLISSNNSFKITREVSGDYQLTEGTQEIKCKVKVQGPLEDLLQISEELKITHPSVLGEPLQLCDDTGTTFKHIKLGKSSTIYLIARDQTTHCLLDDPQKLLNEGKRTFIIDNISHDEIQELVNQAKTLSQNSQDCVKSLQTESL